jgi:hypothetical protein
MWVLSFLPDAFLFWVINVILVVGLAGTLSSYFIRFIPFLFPYATPVKICGIILLVLGVWFRGGYDVEMAWRNKVADLETKIAVSEQQSKEANTKLETVVKEKVKIVKEIQVVIQDRIVKEASKIDAECKVVPEVITILNDAARPVK